MAPKMTVGNFQFGERQIYLVVSPRVPPCALDLLINPQMVGIDGLEVAATASLGQAMAS